MLRLPSNKRFAPPMGFEPMIPCVTGKYSRPDWAMRVYLKKKVSTQTISPVR